MSLLTDLPRPFFILAPMDDVTDSVFRRVIASTAAPDLFFTEFANVDGLQSIGRPKVLKKLLFTPVEQPLVAQIWGKNPENFYTTARQIADGTIARECGLLEGVNFAGIDINMGCPDKTVVKNGTCSALILNRPLASEIIKAVQAGVADGMSKGAGPAGGVETGAGQTVLKKIPVSVKTRLGFNSIDYSWHEFLLGHDLDMLTIHTRTRKEMSLVPAHWQDVAEIRRLRDELSPRTLLVGNGDVESYAQGMELAAAHGLDGIMVGRGIFHDPYVLAPDSPWPKTPPRERLALYEQQVRLFAETWQHNERPVKTLNRFCKVYVNGFDGAKELREQLMAATSTDGLLRLLAQAMPNVPHVSNETIGEASSGPSTAV